MYADPRGILFGCENRTSFASPSGGKRGIRVAGSRANDIGDSLSDSFNIFNDGNSNGHGEFRFVAAMLERFSQASHPEG